jgi:hypothetical protein
MRRGTKLAAAEFAPSYRRASILAAAHVGLRSITLDTDTTVHTLYGRQMGARKGYNSKNKGKKSYQPRIKGALQRAGN